MPNGPGWLAILVVILLAVFFIILYCPDANLGI
jgi:hypothetical protein